MYKMETHFQIIKNENDTIFTAVWFDKYPLVESNYRQAWYHGRLNSGTSIHHLSTTWVGGASSEMTLFIKAWMEITIIMQWLEEKAHFVYVIFICRINKL